MLCAQFDTSVASHVLFAVTLRHPYVDSGTSRQAGGTANKRRITCTIKSLPRCTDDPAFRPGRGAAVDRAADERKLPTCVSPRSSPDANSCARVPCRMIFVPWRRAVPPEAENASPPISPPRSRAHRALLELANRRAATCLRLILRCSAVEWGCRIRDVDIAIALGLTPPRNRSLPRRRERRSRAVSYRRACESPFLSQALISSAATAMTARDRHMSAPPRSSHLHRETASRATHPRSACSRVTPCALTSSRS